MAIKTKSAPKEENQWGFVRETREKAQKDPIDKDTGLCRTGLEDYLAVIFPDISSTEWEHGKSFKPGKTLVKRVLPDYQCKKLRLVIEFDGTGHYKDEAIVKGDREKDKLYGENGYKVIRIPYFIQLTNVVVKKMFNRDVTATLFPDTVQSMGPKGKNMPSICCDAGISRMANDFLQYPQQLLVNYRALKDLPDEKTGLSRLVNEINNAISESSFKEIFVDKGQIESSVKNMQESVDYAILKLDWVDPGYDVFLKYRRSLAKTNCVVSLKSVQNFGPSIPYAYVILKRKSGKDDEPLLCFQYNGDILLGKKQKGKILESEIQNQIEVSDDIRILIFQLEAELIS